MEHDFDSLTPEKRSILCSVYRHGYSIPKHKVHRLRAKTLVEQQYLIEFSDRYCPAIDWYNAYKKWMAEPAYA